MNRSGHKVETIYFSCGGQARNQIYAHFVADICGLRVQMPTEASASVTVGSAILGQMAALVTMERSKLLRSETPILSSQTDAEATAQQYAGTLWNLMEASTKPGQLIEPTNNLSLHKLFDTKYRIFLECIDLQRRWRTDIDSVLGG